VRQRTVDPIRQATSMIRNEEQEHADEIAERIVQIGGEPGDCRYCLTAP